MSQVSGPAELRERDSLWFHHISPPVLHDIALDGNLLHLLLFRRRLLASSNRGDVRLGYVLHDAPDLEPVRLEVEQHRRVERLGKEFWRALLLALLRSLRLERDGQGEQAEEEKSL